ncbi:MAG: cadmium-translocating P-type ATPase, partial [Myxococcales bacterium]|nr:cadmium-translocating P-type ATPase [Myxococcales bacterium]
DARLSDIVGRVQALGYRALALDSDRRLDSDLIVRVGVSAFCAINVMMLHVALYAGWFSGMAERYAQLLRWGSLLMATPAALFGAEPFFVRAWQGLKHRVLQMDVPIALAVSIMYGHGVISTLLGQDSYLDSMTMLIALLLTGRLLESRGRARAEAAADSLLASAPGSARRLVGEQVEDVPIEEVNAGDVILVGAGQACPVDGTILNGNIEVDLSLISGESSLRQLGPGEALPTGALVASGSAEIHTTAVGEQTVLAQMAKRVSEARSLRPTRRSMADRIAPIFTLGTLLAALGAFALWSFISGPSEALPITIAVLVVACPCALALGTPTTFAAGIAAAARRGAFIGNPDALTQLRNADLLLLDKTGTITEGTPRVVSGSDEAIRLATGLERHSTHPVARAILAEAKRRRIAIPAASAVVEEAGKGISGIVDGERLSLRRTEGGVGLFREDALVETIVLRDMPKPEAAKTLSAIGIEYEILTGDGAQAAERIAHEVGDVPVRSELLPDQKGAIIDALRKEGRRVIFAGDGINDAPALSSADVGIAMGSGAAAAISAADVVVIGESLEPIAECIRIAHETARVVRDANRFSIAYNTLAVGAAFAGLVNPLVAAALMPMSSALVVLNTLRIERRLNRGHRNRAAAAVAESSGGVRLALRESGA